MKKYRPSLTGYEKEQLEKLRTFNFTDWSEADVREDFIKPLLDLLGYIKDSDYDISREESYNLQPLFLQPGSGSKRIRLDYICSIRKNKFWIIEAKSGKDEDIKREDIEQAYFYSLHPEIDCPYFLVTNGWYINLYERNSIDNELNPTLSLSSDSLTEDNFLKLDSYIGSTQLLSHLKMGILEDIKKVLSTEIYLGRLDEFTKEVEKAVGSITDTVIDNYKKNVEIQEQRSDEELKKFIDQELLRLVPHSVFNYRMSKGFSQKISKLILERFKESIGGERYLFLDNLLLMNARPVTHHYYYNVLRFLIDLYREDITPTRCFAGDNSKEILLYWIRLLLFGLAEMPVLRYLWGFEGLVNRLTIRTLILSPDSRKKIISDVDNDLYELDEEIVAFINPHPAEKIITTIESQTIKILSQTLVQFYQSNEHRDEFKEALCYQEYKKFKEYIEKVEENTESEYMSIKEGLGSEWGTLGFEESINHFWDSLSSGVCGILHSEPDILELLSAEERKRIEILARMRIDYNGFKDSKIVNYAGECCDVLGIDAPETKISLDKAEKYFDPKEDTFSFDI